MNISVGIVGLPNVGKSTLFNALLKKQQALAANYPFATIEPNVGIVPVPDERLNKLAEITKEEEKMGSLPPLKPATVEFVDIAGLVKGASEGAGLGNKFLSHIREVKVIAHVVRAFVDDNVIREGSSDPESDYATIQTELLISDIQTVTKSLENRKIEPGIKALYERVLGELNEGTPARAIEMEEDERLLINDLFLLSSKPELIVLNVNEDEYSLVNNTMIIERYQKLLTPVIPAQAGIHGSPIGVGEDNYIVICAKIESELASLSEEEQVMYLQDLGFPTSGLERLITKAYEKLGLISFLTAGEKEVRAWTIRKGSTAVLAAGEIHTDFMKKFIKAEIVGYTDFVENRGWKGSREKGKARLEGKEYIMKDGDVVEFKIGA